METTNTTASKTATLQSFTPELMRGQLQAVRSPQQALAVAGQYPTLANLRRRYGDKAEIVIKLWLADLSELINLKRPLNRRMIDVIAREVMTRYYTLTIADIHVVMQRAIAGEWGDYYEALDVPKVLRWFASYFDERCSLAELESQNTAYYDKGGNITPERMKKHFDNLMNKTKR